MGLKIVLGDRLRLSVNSLGMYCSLLLRLIQHTWLMIVITRVLRVLLLLLNI